MLSTRTLKQQRDQFFSSVHSADGLRYLWSERALVRRSRDSLSLVVGLIAWGDPRPKSGALGAQILKFSKECLLRILAKFSQKGA